MERAITTQRKLRKTPVNLPWGFRSPELLQFINTTIMKYILLVLVLGLIVIGAYLLLPKGAHLQNSGVSVASSTPASSSTDFGAVSVFSGARDLKPDFPTIINTSTAMAVSFKNFVSGRGGYTADVYVGTKKAGIVAGRAIAQSVFSSDNQYLALRLVADLGAADIEDTFIDIFNLKTATSSVIKSPLRVPNQGPTDKFIAVGPYIESISWEASDSLDVVSYAIGFAIIDRNYTYYRVSPKQLWRYDLSTRTYTLLETLPETSSTVL